MFFNRPKEETKKIVEYPILEINKPNSNGNFYPEIEAEKMLDIFSQKGYLLGDHVERGVSRIIEKSNESKTTHRINHLFREDDFIVAVIEFYSDYAYEKFSDNLAIFRPTVRGSINDEGEIKVIDLISIDLLELNDKMIPQNIEWEKIKKKSD
jgi:hypothetical protein